MRKNRKRKPQLGRNHPMVETWDDQRKAGTGILVTLRAGWRFAGGAPWALFQKPSEARAAMAHALWKAAQKAA